MDFGTIVNVVTLGVVSVGGYLVSLAKVGFEARVKTSVEESVKLAVKNANWMQELSQELEKVRGTERQELRFKSYGLLWAELRPLALYDAAPVDQASARELAGKLTAWYFSADGGLMLTAPVRGFYFALQDLLQAITQPAVSAWAAPRDPDAKDVFKKLVLSRKLANALRTLSYIAGEDPKLPLTTWPNGAEALARDWGNDLKSLAEVWSQLDPPQQFAVLQRAGSILRTAMTCDVESRIR